MRHASLRLLLIVVLGVSSTAAVANEWDDSASAIAALIDEASAEIQQADPGALAEPLADGPFLRRVTLDLWGRVPTVAETRAYLNDSRPDKRRRLIRAMLAAPAFSRRWARVLRREWLPQTDVSPQDVFAPEVDAWLRERLARREPIDVVARELVGSSSLDSPLGAPRGERRTLTLLALANEAKPDRMAANATRSFLGLSLECAQCHDHPFDKWSQQQFWKAAAFFQPVANEDSGDYAFQIAIADEGPVVTAAVPEGPEPIWPKRDNRDAGPQAFAQWLTDRRHARFARNLVNRVWAKLWGPHLVESVDAGDSPEADLLASLAERVAADGCRLDALIGGVLLSDAYGRSADLQKAPGSASWARQARVRGLTAEQLFDSLRVAAGFAVVEQDLDAPAAIQRREAFLRRFASTSLATGHRSILQSLDLMNGEVVAECVDPRRGPLLAATSAPFLSREERIETLYLATLSRRPTTAELQQGRELLAAATSPAEEAARRSDLLWTLLNSVEFCTNH